MSKGSGLYLLIEETDPQKQNRLIRQLIEGRSNAVGTVTLTGDGVATTTTVSATTCSPSSVVILFPATAHAAAVVASTYVLDDDVTAGQFIVTHATTANADVTFSWVCIG